MKSLLSALQVAPLMLQPLLVVMLFVRRMHRDYPIFSAYVITDLALSTVLLLMSRGGWGGPNAYAGGYAIYVIAAATLSFMAIYEAFSHFFAPYRTLTRLQKTLFRWSGFLLIVIIAVLALAGGHREAKPWLGAILLLELGTRFAQLTLVTLLLIFAFLLNAKWKSTPIGIALGFGIFATVDLTLVTFRGRWGPEYREWFDILRGSAANIQLLVWMGYVALHRVEESTVGDKQLLKLWDDGLERRLHLVERPPAYLSQLESAVDRVMSASDAQRAREESEKKKVTK